MQQLQVTAQITPQAAIGALLTEQILFVSAELLV
jgi:hypothetical protein